MSRREAFWFVLFLTGLALIHAGKGWREVCINVGIGIVGWCVGHALR